MSGHDSPHAERSEGQQSGSRTESSNDTFTLSHQPTGQFANAGDGIPGQTLPEPDQQHLDELLDSLDPGLRYLLEGNAHFRMPAQASWTLQQPQFPHPAMRQVPYQEFQPLSQQPLCPQHGLESEESEDQAAQNQPAAEHARPEAEALRLLRNHPEEHQLFRQAFDVLELQRQALVRELHRFVVEVQRPQSFGDPTTEESGSSNDEMEEDEV